MINIFGVARFITGCCRAELVFLFDAILAISRVIEYYAVFVFLALGVIAAFTVNKRSALLIALVLAAVSGPLLKEYYVQDRPCVDGPDGSLCPATTGLPSIHALTATIFAVASLGTPSLLFFAPVAAVIALSRIYLNFHSPEQVAAGMALGIALFSFAEGILARFKREKPFSLKEGKKNAASKSGKTHAPWSLEMEARRQALHVIFGACIIALALWAGVPSAVTLLAIALAVGLFTAGLVMLGWRVPLAGEILQTFERKKVMPGKGAMHYAAGCLLLLTFGQANFALAMVAVLAFGDGASTIVGRAWGKKKLPWNSKKSWAGTAAFFAFGAAASAFFIALPQALAYSFLLALIETIPADVDDNLLVPVSALALQTVSRALFGI